MMEIVLREDIAALGKVGDVVKVRDGYARNYLLPKRMAYLATAGNKRRLEDERKRLEEKQEEKKQAARVLAKKIEALTLEIAKQVGDEDKLYGSVTAHDIDKALEEEGIQIDRKSISFGKAIKALGDYQVEVCLHSDVIAKCSIKVIRI
jgi:large subunit ribosomal protein L9